MAPGVSGSSGSALHLVLQQSAVPALLARVHQGAHGVRKAARFPRRHHLQPEPAAAEAHEENGHLQRGQVAGSFREELANYTRSERGAHPAAERRRRRGRAVVPSLADFGLQSLPASSAGVPAVHEAAPGPTRAPAGGDAVVLSVSRGALWPAQLQHRECIAKVPFLT